jgi:hypothetical protein
MVMAAAQGMIDFREADPQDKRWWFKLRMLLDHIERTNIVSQHRLYYDYDLAILARDELTDRASRQFVKDAESRLYKIVNLWRPWETHDPAEGPQAQIEAMSAAWAQEYGDPSAPETQKAIAETVRMLQKMDKGARKPTHAAAVLR